MNFGLHFILPAAKSGTAKDPTPVDPEQNPPPEKFQMVMERLVGIFSRGNQPANQSAKGSSNPPAEQGKQGKVEGEITKNQLSHSDSEPKETSKSDTTPPQTEMPEVVPVVVPAIAAALIIEKPSGVTLVRNTKAQAKSSSTAAVTSLPDKSPVAASSTISRAADIPPGKNEGSANLTKMMSPATTHAATGNPKGIGTQTPGKPSEASIPKVLIPQKGNESEVKVNSSNSLKNDSQPLKSQPSDAGMTVAQQGLTMKMATKKTNFTGSEQKLPGAVMATGGEKLPPGGRTIVASTSVKNVAESVATPDLGLSTGTAAITINAKQAVVVPQNSYYSAQLIQRTQELASLQVMRMQETGANEMRVVIKPDTGLQLSLHLQQRDGAIEIQASSDRESYDLLSRHWPELQQQLGARGVRVAPLENTEESFGGGSEGFRQPTTTHGQHPGDNNDQAETPSVFTSGLPTATATASASGISTIHISTSRLETWA